MVVRKFVRWSIIATLSVLAAITAGALLLVHNWPYRQAAINHAIAEKFSSTVESKSFRSTYFPPGCVATDITLWRKGQSDNRPFVHLEKLVIRGSYLGMLGTPKRIAGIRLEGLRILVPRRNDNGEDAGEPRAVAARQNPTSTTQPKLIVGEIAVVNAEAMFASSKPQDAPLTFVIHDLALGPVSDGRPMRFHAALRNAIPPGELRVEGELGPLRSHDRGRMALAGSYVLADANLGVFSGIAGTLSSRGKFAGLLERLEIDGNTQTPDFQVTRSPHAISLATQFHAIVDGTNGSVTLESVIAKFENTTIRVHGFIGKREGDHGRTIALEAVQQEGWMQDWLRLLSEDSRPAFAGSMTFQARVTVPPGQSHFFQRVQMAADFAIERAKFTHPATQKKIDSLSQTASGAKENDNPPDVPEKLAGNVTLKATTANFSKLSFVVPGAVADLHGTYGLLTEKVDFHGTLQADHSLEKETKGLKSVLLKAVSPFVKKKRNGREILPVKLGGTYDHPTYALDVAPG